MTANGQEDMPWIDEASPGDMRRVVQALYRVHRLIGVITDSDALLARIAEESRSVAQAEASALILFDEKTQELYFHVALGESGDQETLKEEVRLKLGQGIAGVAAESRTSINVEDAGKDGRFYRAADAATQFQTRNLLAVPMLDHDKLVGVLEVVNKISAPAFTTLDMRVMEMFAAEAAVSIVNARLISELVRKERLAAIGQAVTGLSHYTKNIVTGLSGSAELIEMGLEDGNIEVLRRSFPVFRRSTKRISNFVQDMLSFSKARAPAHEKCTLGEIIKEAQETFADLFEQKKIDVATDISGVNGPIYVDSQSIFRCMLNLLTNAADAVPRTGGEIKVEARSINENIEITVTDNGAGVPQKDRDKIFDPFFSTKGAQGTGLGLAVTKKIIEEHGGTITVEDAPAAGALFRIFLPAHTPPSPETIG